MYHIPESKTNSMHVFHIDALECMNNGRSESVAAQHATCEHSNVCKMWKPCGSWLPTDLEQPLLVVAIPYVDHTIATTGCKRAKQGMIRDGADRVYYINPVLIAPMTLHVTQQQQQQQKQWWPKCDKLCGKGLASPARCHLQENQVAGNKADSTCTHPMQNL